SPEHGLPVGAPPADALPADALPVGALPVGALPAGAALQDPPAPPARPEPRHPPSPHAPQPLPGTAAETVDAYLAREQARLSDLISRLREIISGAGTDALVSRQDYAAIRPILTALDYVYLDFPDPPSPSRSFLGRVLLSALDYEGRVRRARLLRERLPRSSRS
ncbi:MAG: hypothetical protein ACOC4A_02165, partial [Spirochaetota bacterium]